VPALSEPALGLSRLGLGGWVFGGGDWAMGWGPQEDEESIRTVRHALRRGLNWIDLAPVYGLGHAEELVGRVLRELPAAERPLVFTKCGLAWGELALGACDGRAASPSSIERQLAGSLRRLGVEHLDVYQVHWPAGDGTPLEEYWSYLAGLRERGLVRAIGLSNHSAADLSRAQAVAPVDVCQPQLSLLRRDAAEVIAWCAGHGVEVVVYSPLESGLLSGSFDAERARTLPPGDWRAADPRFAAPGLRAIAPVTEALAAVAARHRVVPGAVALAWTLSWPGVTGAIVGARSPGQIDDWSGAGALRLEPEDLAALEAAARRSPTVTGPAHPLAAQAGHAGERNIP
jgi:aryl-alcohol dehydrogenase-like predicted oxidoreductase